jgi:hypothetical protein
MSSSQQARTSHVSIPKGTWYDKSTMTLGRGTNGARDHQEMLMANGLCNAFARSQEVPVVARRIPWRIGRLLEVQSG